MGPDKRPPENPGELNYVITCLIDDYLLSMPESYKAYNQVMGVIECVKLEAYRRLVSGFEDKKKELNGEVFQSI